MIESKPDGRDAMRCGWDARSFQGETTLRGPSRAGKASSMPDPRIGGFREPKLAACSQYLQFATQLPLWTAFCVANCEYLGTPNCRRCGNVRIFKLGIAHAYTQIGPKAERTWGERRAFSLWLGKRLLDGEAVKPPVAQEEGTLRRLPVPQCWS